MLNHRQLAADIAQFLLALHRFPITAAEASGLPGPGVRWAELEILRDDVLPPLRAALTSQEYQVVERWWNDFLADPVLQRYTPVLQHGDLWYENMLVDIETGKQVGIVDFEAAAIGDLAQDFATQLYFGAQFVANVVAA